MDLTVTMAPFPSEDLGGTFKFSDEELAKVFDPETLPVDPARMKLYFDARSRHGNERPISERLATLSAIAKIVEDAEASKPPVATDLGPQTPVVEPDPNH